MAAPAQLAGDAQCRPDVATRAEDCEDEITHGLQAGASRTRLRLALVLPGPA
jgi:hypothetical protein